MKDFLDHIIADISPEELGSLKDKCFVFPSRRACLHFHHKLVSRFESELFISPQVQSIEEFVEEHAEGLVVADELTLLFKLYKVFKTEEPDLSFEDFYVWGQTLLKDFDEIDRYLVDGSLVYQNLQEIQDIEASFGPNEEMQKAFVEFQKVIEVSENATLFNNFHKNWLKVGRVLPKFKVELEKEGIAYSGLCYRKVAEFLAKDELKIEYNKIVFCGFNALSNSEEKIIDLLLRKEQAVVYFDADAYYLNDEDQEAGHFLRYYKKKWRNKKVNWIITNGFDSPKQINVTAVSQKVVQARHAVHELVEKESAKANNAIVLADETLLFPVLYAVPENIALNITMGYPLLSSGTGELISAYISYQATIADNSRSSKNPLLDQSAFLELVSQPALQLSGIDKLKKIGYAKSRWLKWSNIQEHLDAIDQPTIGLMALLPSKDIQSALSSLTDLILLIEQIKKEEDQAHAAMDEQITMVSVKYLEGLNSVLNLDQLDLNFYTLQRVISETLKQLKVPFMGEPLVGLQIMGFLETRTLDFDNLVLLSVNEGLLPSASNSKTYLPFAMRKSFGLPTFIEHNSIYAYHFFRLLQRASNISLIYNAELAFDGSGEKSRFLLQLIKNLSSRPNIKLVENNLITPIENNIGQHSEIIVEKTGLALTQLVEHKNSLRERALTPTALLNYVECSIKYYFSRILKIKSPEIESTEIDARDFGNLLHGVMEQIYLPHLNKTLSADDIKRIQKHELQPVIDDVFKEYLQYHMTSSEITFVQHVIEHLTIKILAQDAQDAPLKIVDLESEKAPLEYNLQLNNGVEVKLGGKIDRLDALQQNEHWLYRILDYKTGKFQLGNSTFNRKPLSDEDYISQYFKNSDLKSGFQTYFYALLFNKLHPQEKITGGIIGAKNINQGVTYLRDQKEPLDNGLIMLFEQNLKRILEELFDPNIPFVQTEDEKRCLYCDFKNICNR